MKKFTLLAIAALISVVAFAQKKQPLELAKLSNTVQVTKTFSGKAALPQNGLIKPFEASADSKLVASMRTKAVAKAKKAPRKEGLADLLGKDLMLLSDYYEVGEDDSIVEGEPAAGGWPITVTLVDEETIAIDNFVNGATEAVEAKVALTTDADLLAQGVVAQFTIAADQTLYESQYGPVLLGNALEDADLEGYVFADGTIIIDGLWYDYLGGTGQYAGYMFSGYLYASVIAAANGTMNGVTTRGVETNATVYILLDPENPKTVSVFNFADMETAIDVTMKEGNRFVINEQFVFYYDSQYGAFYTTGILIKDGMYYIDVLDGTGDANTLTIDGNWSLYSPTSYSLFNIFEPGTTITLNDGQEFVYPVIADVAATPADPSILEVGPYDTSEGYGYVLLDVPTTDVDGNDIKESKLSYQLFSDIEKDIQPIVFTPELYDKLTEDLSIIPYEFTDSYDFVVYGANKLVYLLFLI